MQFFKNLGKLDKGTADMKENTRKEILFLSLIGILFVGISLLCINSLFTEVSESFIIQGFYFILMISIIAFFPFLGLYCFWNAIKLYQEYVDSKESD